MDNAAPGGPSQGFVQQSSGRHPVSSVRGAVSHRRTLNLPAIPRASPGAFMRRKVESCSSSFPLGRLAVSCLGVLLSLLATPAAIASEAELVIPDLASVDFLGVSGRTLLFTGIGVCFLGLAFGLVMYRQLQALPVHSSMREISELIYEPCKTYLLTQAKFILILRPFITVIMVAYFGRLR